MTLRSGEINFSLVGLIFVSSTKVVELSTSPIIPWAILTDASVLNRLFRFNHNNLWQLIRQKEMDPA